jgi:uncharacterized membrane protein SirB2
MSYALFKGIHLTTVAVTLALFLLRGTWMMLDSGRLNSRWVRVLPHVNDVLLLLSAIALTIILNQYPFTQGWLTAKFFALILYIVLGTVALKPHKGIAMPLEGTPTFYGLAPVKDRMPVRGTRKEYAARRSPFGRSWRGKPLRIAAWLAALGVFAYMVAVAVSHDPMPWL